MSDVFEEAARRAHLRFPGSDWDILTLHEQADAIWEELHRIDMSGGLRRFTVPQQPDDNPEQPADQEVARRRHDAV